MTDRNAIHPTGPLVRDDDGRLVLKDDPKPDNWRPSWDAYHMAFAKLAATRGSCDRKRVGATIVINNRLVATGYNGAQSGAPSCIQVGHQMVTINGRESCVRTLHAEVNAIIQCAPSDFVEEQRSGTWATIRRARAAKLWTILVYPDGTWADDRPEFRPEWCKVPDRCWCELGVHTQCQMCFNGMPYCSCNFCNWPDEYEHRWDGDQCVMCGYDAVDATAARNAGHELMNCNTMREQGEAANAYSKEGQ